MHCFVRQSVVHRAGNVHAGEVKVIRAAGIEGELLCVIKLRRQLVHVCRDAATRYVELAIAAKPLKVAAGIPVRAGQAIGGRCGKALAFFYDDLDMIRVAAQFPAAKVESNDLQPVRAQRAGVQDLKNRAETEVRGGVHSIAAAPAAGRIVPANRTVHLRAPIGILPPGIYFVPVFDISAVLVQYLIPFVALGRAALGLARACTTTSRRRRTQRIAHAAGGVVFAENQICGVQVIPANRMRYGIVRHEQAVGILVLLCILLCGCHLRHELVGVHCSGVGKGNIVQRRIRQAAVRRAGNTHAGEVEVIGAAGSKGELLWEIKLRRQLGYIRRNAIAGRVQFPIAAKPLKITVGISLRAGQTVGRRRGKFAALFHNDLNILEAITQLAAAKVKGNGLQSVRDQCAGVQDFKDGAETDRRAGALGPAGGPVAGRNVPAKRTGRPRRARNILPPRMHPAPVFDISAVLVQYPVPFVALRRAALGLARACTITSHGRRTQHIFHAAGCAVLAENQPSGIQLIPAYLMRYGKIRNE